MSDVGDMGREDISRSTSNISVFIAKWQQEDNGLININSKTIDYSSHKEVMQA